MKIFINIFCLISTKIYIKLLCILFFSVFCGSVLAESYTSINFTNRATGHTDQELSDLDRLISLADESEVDKAAVWINLDVEFYADADQKQKKVMRRQIRELVSTYLQPLIRSDGATILRTPHRLREAPGIYVELSAEAILELSGYNFVRNIIYMPDLK